MSEDRPNIYLTFDLDWAHDAIIAALLDRLEKEGLTATIFVSHETELLSRMRNNNRLELGLHPNFRPLFNGQGAVGESARTVLQRLKALLPEAVSVRAHGLTDGSDLQALYAECGLSHDSSQLIPWTAGLTLKPYKYLYGLTRAPYNYEDDVHCMLLEEGRAEGWRAGPFLEREGLKVFTFHPIHLFLNTEHLGRYQSARPFFRDPAALARRRNESVHDGAAVFFDELLTEARRRNFRFAKIKDIVAGQ